MIARTIKVDSLPHPLKNFEKTTTLIIVTLLEYPDDSRFLFQKSQYIVQLIRETHISSLIALPTYLMIILLKNLVVSK